MLSGCSIYAGTTIDKISGAAQLDGSWDGTRAKLTGNLNLDSISIFRQQSGQAYQITNVVGPISYRDNRFTAGTESAIPPRPSDNYDRSQRIRGQVVDGNVYLDAVVNLLDLPEYKVFVQLENGRLERYAQEYLHGHSRLAGVMNGALNVRGKGTTADRMVGEGQLVIAPAALYDSSLFTQLFKLIQFQPPAGAEFEQARMKFTVANERFDFNSIELLGDNLPYAKAWDMCVSTGPCNWIWACECGRSFRIRSGRSSL